MDNAPDFTVSNHGSIILLFAKSDAAKEWADEYLPEDRTIWAGATVVEPRYIDHIVTGIEMAGMIVT